MSLKSTASFNTSEGSESESEGISGALLSVGVAKSISENLHLKVSYNLRSMVDLDSDNEFQLDAHYKLNDKIAFSVGVVKFDGAMATK